MTQQAKDPQGELPMFQVDPADPNILWLERYLKEHRDWMTAREVLVIAGKEDGDEGRIISGQKGYKHLETATTDEVNRFVNWMESQGKKMIGRAERMRRNAHAVLG